MKEFHRHLGVYGVCFQNNQLLVVHKTRGPYQNRFDLPGGTIEDNESIIEAIHREFKEETGLIINVDGSIGLTEFIIKYSINKKTHIQHLAMFLKVSIKEVYSQALISDDTEGVEWINIEEITSDNSSPLVIAAKQYIETQKLSVISLRLDDWQVKEKKV